MFPRARDHATSLDLKTTVQCWALKMCSVHVCGVSELQRIQSKEFSSVLWWEQETPWNNRKIHSSFGKKVMSYRHTQGKWRGKALTCMYQALHACSPHPHPPTPGAGLAMKRRARGAMRTRPVTQVVSVRVVLRREVWLQNLCSFFPTLLHH